jgi:hypothetical protein
MYNNPGLQSIFNFNNRGNNSQLNLNGFSQQGINPLASSSYNVISNPNAMDISNLNIQFKYDFQPTVPTTIKSIIGIGNPIVDITAECDDETLKKYGLEFGGTVFANEKNMSFYHELETKPEVTYIPGGSITNTLRVCSWALSMDPSTKDNFTLSLLGAVGNDLYKDKILAALERDEVKPILQIKTGIETSRCGVAINKKERCLLTHIRASNLLDIEFVNANKEKIMQHDCLI